ncbi:hypothetical protein [Sphingomonas sp. Leaf4]|uniref:hypothetical protein n=1 Tax=Sphingomonas sp. Leaf4 TaxID=2876553 RepID=UPI001E49C982|nr:hypothetical protein [Sphingomonas sp. Leaf4]
MIFLTVAALLSQQIDKFDSRPPAFSATVDRKMEDVERCMIRYGYPPIVYRQPDRPDQVTIVWTAAGNAAGRVDLSRDGSKTTVKSWLPVKAIRECAGI